MGLGSYVPAHCPTAAVEAARHKQACTLLLGTGAYPLECKELVIGETPHTDFITAKLADGKTASINCRHILGVIV